MRSLISIIITICLGIGIRIYWEKATNPTKPISKLEERFSKLPEQVKKFPMESVLDIYEIIEKVNK